MIFAIIFDMSENPVASFWPKWRKNINPLIGQGIAAREKDMTFGKNFAKGSVQAIWKGNLTIAIYTQKLLAIYWSLQKSKGTKKKDYIYLWGRFLL